jgi:hypothetical protein
MQPAARAAIIWFLCMFTWSCTKIDALSKHVDAGSTAAGQDVERVSGGSRSPNGGTGGESGGSGASAAEGGGSIAAGRGGSAESGRGGRGGAGGVNATVSGGPTVAGTGGGSADIPIRGHVIDYFGNPAPNVEVSVGDKTVATGNQGEFELQSSPGVYSIAVSVEVPRLKFLERTQYLFVNVTRRDPTLQVMHGLPEVGAHITRKISGVSFPLPDSEQIAVDFANPYGGFSDELSDASSTSDTSWYGPANVSGYVHALHIRRATAAALLPASYLAHGSAGLALASGQDASFSIDLTSSAALATGTVSGNVSGSGPGSQHNAVFVRFNDRALVQVVDDTAPQPNFGYVVPSLPNSSISVAAMRGDFDTPPFAVRYAEGIGAGSSNVNLAIPAPIQLLAPAGDAAGVNADTTFSWSGEDHVYVMFVELGGGVDDNYYVITTDKHAKLPLQSNAAPKLVSNGTYYWRISTHGELTSMDEATGTNGYMDAYSTGRLRGPKHDTGSYTLSEVRPFSTAP